MTTPQAQLSQIFEILCEQLDITPTQYDDAKSKYEAVGDWLGKPESELAPFKPQVYAQGSIRLGTTVKPLAHDEFDVDLVCEFGILPSSNPATVKKMVGDRLKKHDTYKAMITEKNRCWQLNYAKQFHMDILPAVPDTSKRNGCLWVPDKDLAEWKPSNPKGYAEWFKEQMRTIQILMEKRAEVEPMPNAPLGMKTPLQRSVQILKRHRDMVFKDDAENAPISIIITTLAAKAYKNQEDLFEALISIINGMLYEVDVEGGMPTVPNPMNPEENFAEKWLSDKERLAGFIKWLRRLHVDLDDILKKRGLPMIQESLTPLFGDKIANTTMNKYASVMEEQRKSGKLKMASGTGLLGAIGTAVGGNTFYGG